MMNWIKIRIFLMILMIAPAVINDTEKCEPFKALFIWHPSKDDKSFVLGRRLLIPFIKGLPRGTDVIVMTTVANATNIEIQFKKNDTEAWMKEIVLHKPGNSGNHVISSNDTSEAVFKYLDQNKTPKSAEEVFLIVTNKSVIDNEGKVKEALRKKKTFVVVVYGNQTDRNAWTDLATDNNHLKILQDDNLNSTIKSLRNLSCKDSNHYLEDTDPRVKTSAEDQNFLKTIHESVTRNTSLITINTSLISVVIFVFVICFCFLCRKPIKNARTILENFVCKNGNVQTSQDLAKPSNHIRVSVAHQPVGIDNTNHNRDSTAHQAVGIDNTNHNRDSMAHQAVRIDNPNHNRDSMTHQAVGIDNTNHNRDSMAHQAVGCDNSENECNTELPERRRNNPSPAEYGSESFISIQEFGVTRQDIPDPTEITPGVNPEARALITGQN